MNYEHKKLEDEIFILEMKLEEANEKISDLKCEIKELNDEILTLTDQVQYWKNLYEAIR